MLNEIGPEFHKTPLHIALLSINSPLIEQVRQLIRMRRASLRHPGLRPDAQVAGVRELVVEHLASWGVEAHTAVDVTGEVGVSGDDQTKWNILIKSKKNNSPGYAFMQPKMSCSVLDRDK